MSDKQYARIMMIGKSGVGKSSFLNYLLDGNYFQTREGERGTTGFDTLEFDDVNGIPLQVYDSKGLEVLDLEEIKTELIEFIKGECNQSDPRKWLHSIFYCVNAKNDGFEQAEENLISDISKSISQTVHVVITHCDPDSPKVKELENYIRSRPILKDLNIHIIKVNSTETRKRNGTVYPAFGREQALKEIFELLWSDMAYKISAQYASECYYCFWSMYSELFSWLDSLVKQCSTIKVLKAEIKDVDIEEMLGVSWDDLEKKLDQKIDQLGEKYKLIINPLVEFYNRYSNGLGYRIEMLDVEDFIPEETMRKIDEIDIDDVLSRTKIGKLGQQIEECDESNTWEMIKMIGKGVGALMRVKSLIKEVITELKLLIRPLLPTEEDIQNEMYRVLMEQIRNM